MDVPGFAHGIRPGALRGLTRLPWISGAFCRKFAGSPVCPLFRNFGRRAGKPGTVTIFPAPFDGNYGDCPRVCPRHTLPRSSCPTDPEVSIPYGAFVENVEADRDFERFTYLGELYECPHKLLASATDPHAWKAQSATATESAAPSASGASQPTPAAHRLQRSEEHTSELQSLRH